jgi:hypothetical protein
LTGAWLRTTAGNPITAVPLAAAAIKRRREALSWRVVMAGRDY